MRPRPRGPRHVPGAEGETTTMGGPHFESAVLRVLTRQDDVLGRAAPRFSPKLTTSLILVLVQSNLIQQQLHESRERRYVRKNKSSQVKS